MVEPWNPGESDEDDDFSGLQAKYSTTTQSQTPSTSTTAQVLKKKTFTTNKTGDKKKPQKHEKSHLTNKFKALLAANLKKHNLGKDIETKVQALYVTKPKRENDQLPT